MKRSVNVRKIRTYLSVMLTLAMLAGIMPVNTYAAGPEPAGELIDVADPGAGEDVYLQAEDVMLTQEGTAGEVKPEAGQDAASPDAVTDEDAAGIEDEALLPDSEGGEESSEVSSNYVEINQGFSSHTGLNDGKETLINEFVAGKQTVVMAKIPGSDEFSEEQAKNAVAKYTLEAKAVTNGQEADNCELSASGDNFGVMQTYDKDCDVVKGWYAVVNFPTGPDKGVYNFYIKDDGKEVAVNKGVRFYETEPLNILVAPVKGYWSGHYENGAPSEGAFGVKDQKFTDAQGNERDWSDLCNVLKEYMLDVYPIKDITFEEANEIEAGTAEYDMVNDNGQKKLWEEACKLQSKTKDGKDRYDLILAFVMYRQDKGSGQGYTFGKPTNIITYSDKDMLPTVAHEIAHCYQVGDEYDGGSYNINVNYAPNGYKGRDFVTGNDITITGADDYWQDSNGFKGKTSGSKRDKINENGKGTVVPLSLHPYSLSQQKFITWAGVNEKGEATGEVYPTMSWMGSGYSGGDGYYFTSSVIWDHLLKQFVKKEKKEEDNSGESSPSPDMAEVTNLDIFRDTSDPGEEDINAVFEGEDDFYYDDDCRWGQSRMVEVYGWLVKEGSSVKAEMSPMFSYDGDLEYMDVIEDENLKKSDDVYTFAALGNDGLVIESPVDGEYAATQFYGGFFNPRTKNGGKMQTEVNFNFDAEYPEGTADFAIFKGKMSDITEGVIPADKYIWLASENGLSGNVIDNKPDGYLAYADVNSERAEVEWEVYYPEDAEEAYTGEGEEKDLLYTEVYYCPEGDDGKAYYVGCSDDEDWEEGYISFETDSQFDTKWTRNAYVWIKVTNGVNAIDIYSDENDISLCNSKIALSGTGIKKVKVNGQTEYKAVCTGGAICPNTSVKVYNPANGKYISLKRNVDYKVTYEDNVSVGYATVTVQGIGNYAGKNTTEFEIVKKTLTGTPDAIPNLVYSDKLDNMVKPCLALRSGNGVPLVYGTDFTVSYSVTGKTGTSLNTLIPAEPETRVTVTVTYSGKGNYTGTCKNKIKFDVIPTGTKTTPITDAEIVLKKSRVQYTGKAVKPAIKSVTVTVSGNRIRLKKADYKVIYSNNKEIGTGRVTIVGKKNYTGSAHVGFTIAPKQVKSISIKGLKNQPYTGTAVNVDTLPITVKAGGITLRKGIDYTIEPVVSSNSVSCNYVDVTTKAMKRSGAAPKILIKLKDTDPNSKDKPRVEWSGKVRDSKKSVIKSFAITALKFSSSVVSFTTSSNVVSNNIVKTPDGREAIGTIRNANKTEMASRKYTFVIEGSADKLVKNAGLKDAVSIRVNGVKIDPALYSIKVTKTSKGKIGTITVVPVKNSPYGGKRTIKFKYVKKTLE